MSATLDKERIILAAPFAFLIHKVGTRMGDEICCCLFAVSSSATRAFAR